MRLLLVTKDFPPHIGSVSTWAQELAQRFVSRCDDFVVLAPRMPGQAAFDREAPFEVLRVPCTRGTFAGVVAVGLGALSNRRRFDVMLGAQWQSSLPGLVWRDRGGPERVFAAVHGRELLARAYHRLPVAPTLYAGTREQVIQRLDGLFPVSHHARDLVARLGARVDHAEVVPSGCNAERFRPATATELSCEVGLARELGLGGRRVILSVGRLVASKGIDSVLFALSTLGTRYPDLRYVVVGDGPERPRLELLAERLRISHKVRFLGQVDEATLPRIYNLCNVFVHAARQERAEVPGFGLALLEASATAKPVVAMQSGGAADAIVHGQTGLVTPPDDVPALAEAIAQLLDQPALARQFGEQGRAYVLRRATWDRVAERLLMSMSEAVPRRPRAVPARASRWSGEHAASL